MHKNGQKCSRKPENQQNGAQKNLNSGLYLKILMPVCGLQRQCWRGGGSQVGKFHRDVPL